MRKINKKNLEIIHNCIKYIVFACVIILYSASLYMNYESNKHFDDLFYFENKDLGISKGFEFTPEAEAEPIFFHTWDCAPTKGNQDYYVCDHCSIFGKCSYHHFEMFELTQEQIDIKKTLMQHREEKQDDIISLSLGLILFCLLYFYWQYKYDHENWSKTPIAKLIKKINEGDNDENK